MFTLILVLWNSVFVYSEPAFAYLDPGSISLALQAILAAIAGIGATYRLWLNKLMVFLGLKNKKRKNEIEDAEQRDYED
jgi:hypothetical protein